jgi:glycosyltransferase involved in cell wall biosynthesis
VKILLLSFYYPPDLSAGSFRATALVRALIQSRDDVEVEVITTQPNRYASFASEALAVERSDRLVVHRVPLPPRRGGLKEQIFAFVSYVRGVYKIIKRQKYDLIITTSSRLMTAALGATVAKTKRTPLYLDIRDIFVDTIDGVLPTWLTTLAIGPLRLVERMTVQSATAVNLVSAGFLDYFKYRYPDRRYTCHTNGIDEEFCQPLPEALRHGTDRLIALYAGNIGDGQGLHLVLPALAKKLEDRLTFRLVGDGGRTKLLQRELQNAGVKNVELFPPVQRQQLLHEYAGADLLFLHLNDIEAFEKVLPSKLFEYGATGKPIWAGLSGHAAEFARIELDNTAIFEPCNIDDALAALNQLRFEVTTRTNFLEKHDRRRIMKEMAVDAFSIAARKLSKS